MDLYPNFGRKALAGAVALAVSQMAAAGTAPYFVPLQQSAAVAPPNHVNELNSPWQAPAGISHVNLTSMDEIESDSGQSTQRVPAGTTSSMWDMLAFSPDGRYVFIPHETPIGAGVTRYDIENDQATLIFAGNQLGGGVDEIRATRDDQWDEDFGAFDPARYTPNGTLILAEEWSGLGRVVEILDPLDTPADPVAGSSSRVKGEDWRVLDSIASVSHEGINFSQKRLNEVIYFIDEDRSGSIYKLELKTPGDYAGGGTTYVLKAQNYLGDVTVNWNDEAGGNAAPAVLASRFGASQWVAITDGDGNPLDGVTSPFGPTTLNCAAGDAGDECRDGDIRPGRVAADDVGGTPFGRPEDMTIGKLPNGNEVLYVTVTSEAGVISIEETADGPYVRLFASGTGASMGLDEGTPKNVGFLPTTGVLNSPDNLAVDALGNVYIIEDAPNSGTVGGDVWFARDTDSDGVAESLDHFLSLQVNGSEATGMIFNPANPTEFVIAVQHPTSVTPVLDTDGDDTPDSFGQGDAMWQFDLAGVTAPSCGDDRRGAMTFDADSRQWVRACSGDFDYNFVNLLAEQDPEGADGFPNP